MAKLTVKQRENIEKTRAEWLEKSRQAVAELAKVAYGLPESPTRSKLMHATMYELQNDRGDFDSKAAGAVWHCAQFTPYGFARYGGRLKAARLVEMPYVLDQCDNDWEPLI